jgi:hypothetical protein
VFSETTNRPARAPRRGRRSRIVSPLPHRLRTPRCRRCRDSPHSSTRRRVIGRSFVATLLWSIRCRRTSGPPPRARKSRCCLGLYWKHRATLLTGGDVDVCGVIFLLERIGDCVDSGQRGERPRRWVPLEDRYRRVELVEDVADDLLGVEFQVTGTSTSVKLGFGYWFECVVRAIDAVDEHGIRSHVGNVDHVAIRARADAVWVDLGTGVFDLVEECLDGPILEREQGDTSRGVRHVKILFSRIDATVHRGTDTGLTADFSLYRSRRLRDAVGADVAILSRQSGRETVASHGPSKTPSLASRNRLGGV